jgi:hypothetical protein
VNHAAPALDPTDGVRPSFTQIPDVSYKVRHHLPQGQLEDCLSGESIPSCPGTVVIENNSLAKDIDGLSRPEVLTKLRKLVSNSAKVLQRDSVRTEPPESAESDEITE